MYNWAGRFNIFIALLLMAVHSFSAGAAEEEFKFGTSRWDQFSSEVRLQKERDRKNGLSYIISGSLAIIGGVVGAGVAKDSAEQLAYAAFETIGVASIGYGAYVWQIGGDERSIYQTLAETKLTAEQKSQFLQAFNSERKDRERRERIVRAITSGFIAGLNIYNGTQQTQPSVQNALYFVGGVNLLAAISYSLDF